MNLYDKIMVIYPSLTIEDFHPLNGTISLRNDSDGNGDYIFKWDHKFLKQPTNEQLQGI